MRKTLIFLVLVGLLAAALGSPALAAKKKKKKPRKTTRTVTSVYEAPALGAGTGVCLRPTNSCGDIATGAKEKWVKVTIEDALGLPVSFTLGQDLDPNTLGTEKQLGEFCGDTGPKAIAIEPGYAIVVFPWALGPACGSVATRGEVIAKLSNLP